MSTNNKFGIGISNPLDNLHVLGAVRFGDSSSSSNQARIFSGSTYSGWQTQAGSNAITIQQSTGNVGIGTVTADYKLEVFGGSAIVSNGVFSNALTFLNKTTPGLNSELGYIDFRGLAPDSNNRRGALIISFGAGTWTNTSTPAYLAFHTTPAGSISSLERLRITSSGNIGIGTTDPGTYRLSVVGDINFTGNLFRNGVSFAGSANWITAGVDIYYNIGKVGIGTTIMIGALNLFTGTSGTSVDPASQGTGTIVFGNAASASASPAIVSKSTNNRGLYVISATSNTNPGEDMKFDVRESDNTDFADLEKSAFAFTRFDTNNLMTILRNGNVGIGTTNPGAKLQIDGSLSPTAGWATLNSTNSKILFYGSGNSTGNWSGMGVDSGGHWWLRTGTSSQNILVMRAGGNVGIGTNNPTQKLDVRGQVIANQRLLLRNTQSSNVDGEAGEFTIYNDSTLTNLWRQGVGNMIRLTQTGFVDLLFPTVVYNTLSVNSNSSQFPIILSNNFRSYSLKIKSNGAFSIADESAGLERVNILNNGNFGVGTTNPEFRLHVTDRAVIGYVPGSVGGVYLTNTSAYGFPAVQAVSSGFGGDTLLLNPAGGNVGIGITTSGTGKLHVVGSVTVNNIALGTTYQWFNSDSSGYLGGAGGSKISSTNIGLAGNFQCSIYASDYVWSSGYIASSDRRIKKEISEIDDGEALNKLRALKPSTYKYVDSVYRGESSVYGFIAQEVKEVLPYAVSSAQEIIPDIYSLGSVSENNIITLDNNKSHGLVQDDIVKIYKTKLTEQPREYKVLAVVNDYSFVVDNCYCAEDESHRIFVYGKKVSDFHTLDKNAIYTVGIAAMQELDRTVETLKSQLSTLTEILRSKGILE